MKYIPLTLVIVLAFLSCNNDGCESPPQPPHEEVQVEPVLEALQDASLSSFKTYKRGPSLLDEMYYEQVDKREELQKIEQGLKGLRESYDDAFRVYVSVDSKNEFYYDMALSMLSSDEVKDSSLRMKMIELVKESKKRYEQMVRGHKATKDEIASNRTIISDLHTALKLEVTLPIIEAYQKNSLPSIEPLNSYAKKQKEVINMMK